MNIYFYGLSEKHIKEVKKFFHIHSGSVFDSIFYESLNFNGEITASRDKCIYFCVPEASVAGVSGIEFSAEVRAKNANAVIVFLSCNNLSTVSILKKYILPAGYFLFDEISDAVKFVTGIFERENETKKKAELSMEIISQYEKVSIPVSNVVYFMSFNKKLMCKLIDGKSFEFYGTLNHIEQKYEKMFIRCHAGYLINKEKILMINYTKNYIDVLNDESIPISRKYKQDIKNFMDDEYVAFK